jgi:hypothetical protein
VVYPVVVPTVDAGMERPGWRPARDRRGVSAGKTQDKKAGPEQKWPPHGSKAIDIKIVRAAKLPKADRSGHSDPYATCHIPGKPKSKVKTRVVEDTEDPVWDEELTLQGWMKGESLVFSVFDYDLVGADDKLATIQLPMSEFYPSPYEGTLTLQNVWSDGGQRIDGELKRTNTLTVPTLEVRIAVRAEVVKAGSQAGSEAGRPMHLSMPGAVPSMHHVGADLDDFESTKPPVPVLGNFWMTPRSARKAPAVGAAGT